MTQVASGQTHDSSERLRVPVRILPPIQTEQPMMNRPGFVSSSTQIDPLEYYERSKLGRWVVREDVDPDDSVFGIQLDTAAGPIRIRYEVLIEGESFRAAREKTLDELLALARNNIADTAEGEPVSSEADTDTDTDTDLKTERTAPEPYAASSSQGRMIAYARSRGDRLTRYELRRRIADIAGGPALLWTAKDFGADRNETVTLFAFLDTDEDGVISQLERDASGKALNGRDVNSDGRVDFNELQLGLKSLSARRRAGSGMVKWQRWDANQSEHVEDVVVQVAFTDKEDDADLRLNECALGEPWSRTTGEMQQAYATEPHGRVVLLSHPKVSVAFEAVQRAAGTNLDQIAVGVLSEANALFRQLDQDGDWNLSEAERRSCEDVITALDTNADGSLEMSELPVLLRICVARGAVAHEALAGSVSIIQALDEADEQERNLVPPEWFLSMDKDGDRMLTRQEFLGGRASFEKMDADSNELLSVEEALATKSD